MKKILLFMLFLLSTVMFGETLEKITYRNGNFKATLKERKQVSVSAVYNTTASTLILELPNIKLGEKVPSELEINDEFVRKINVSENGNSVFLSFVVNANTNYKIFNKVREVSVEFSKKNILPTETNVKINQNREIQNTVQTAPLVQTETKITTTQPAVVQQTNAIRPSNKKYTIVIDAGHGGKDAGAVANGHKEKDVALAVSQKLANNLRKDFNVIMTRNTDNFIELSERANIGNRANADFFVSIHLNAAGSASANGAEVFYYAKKGTTDYASEVAKLENKIGSGYADVPISDYMINDIFYRINQQKSSAVATDVLDGLISSFGLRRRGVFGANFAVLRGSNSPSILIELGFISNYGDLSHYMTSAGQEKAAASIANAIRKHFK